MDLSAKQLDASFNFKGECLRIDRFLSLNNATEKIVTWWLDCMECQVPAHAQKQEVAFYALPTVSGW